METRRLIVAFLAAMAAFYVWSVIASYIWPRPQPTTQPVASTEPAATQAEAGETQPASGAGASQPSLASISGTATRPAGIRYLEGTSTELIPLGSAAPDSPFPLGIEFDPRGATIADVKTRGHYATVEKKEPYTIILPAKTPEGKRLTSFATAKIRFENLKLDVPLDDATWTMNRSADGETVTGTIELQTADNRPLARVTKEYNLPRQPVGSPRFDLRLNITIQNLTGQPQRIILVQEGPVGFRREDLRAEDRTVVGAMWKGQDISATGHLRADVAKKGRIELGTDQGDARIAWAAEINRYFTCIMAPAERTGPRDGPRFAGIEAIDTAEGTDTSHAEELSALTFQFVTTPRDIAAGAVETVGFNCYIGPKSKKGFVNVPEYAKLDYYAVIKQGFYACAPAGLVSVMMALLHWFYAIWPHNYGLAIIILVLVVRGILHPITKKSQVNMMKMQKQQAALQPKLEAVKKKYANDRTQMNQEIMKVYQEAGVNPAGSLLSCLPLMLQIPVWGALWAALASTIEMRHAPFDNWWIRDLTAPDALLHFSPVYVPLVSKLMGGPFTSLNILPILLGISQLLQTKYMPRGTPSAQAGGAPDQLEQQRKMMMFMSVFFVLMLYNAPSGLNLYIMASNFFGILEQWRIREHIKEEEARLALSGPTPTTSGDDKRLARSAQAPPQKKSWLHRKWENLQKDVEEARRQQSQRDKRGKK